MSDHDFDRKLARLVADVRTLEPGARAGQADAGRSVVEHLRARQEQLKTTAAALQESLDQLRLSVKYLVFDLEATRRENAALRKQIADGEAPPSDE